LQSSSRTWQRRESFVGGISTIPRDLASGRYFLALRSGHQGEIEQYIKKHSYTIRKDRPQALSREHGWLFKTRTPSQLVYSRFTEIFLNRRKSILKALDIASAGTMRKAHMPKLQLLDLTQ
jgi:hypothetical protein